MDNQYEKLMGMLTDAMREEKTVIVFLDAEDTAIRKKGTLFGVQEEGNGISLWFDDDDKWCIGRNFKSIGSEEDDISVEFSLVYSYYTISVDFL